MNAILFLKADHETTRRGYAKERVKTWKFGSICRGCGRIYR